MCCPNSPTEKTTLDKSDSQRPCGTQLGNRVLTQALKPVPFNQKSFWLATALDVGEVKLQIPRLRS
jgi:hypothetical protein